MVLLLQAVILSAVKFHVAPMQCWTNQALRHLFRALSPSAVLWTEMEKIGDVDSREALIRRFGNPDEVLEAGVVLQLGGNDPETVRRVLRRAVEMGYRFGAVNLNCGCPSVESGGAATFGASLMRQPELTRHLLRAVREEVPPETTVSVKARIGSFRVSNLIPAWLLGCLHMALERSAHLATINSCGLQALWTHPKSSTPRLLITCWTSCAPAQQMGPWTI